MTSIRPVLIVALLAGACGGASADAEKPVRRDEQDSSIETKQPIDEAIFGCPEPVAEPIPEAFEDLTLPPGALPVDSPSALPGEERLDLSVPDLTVKEGMEFFKSSLADDGHLVTFEDYEGFESELFFLRDGEDVPGVAWILTGCRDGEITVSIRFSPGLDRAELELDPAGPGG